MKESNEREAELNKKYGQAIELLTTKAKSTQSTCELIIRKCEDEAKTAREELELCRAQIGMEETRIKVLIDKHRQHLSRKIEETLARTWQEWSAQAVELHVMRADAENRQKEGRGFYNMDENNIQLFREYLTEECHNLAKSHTAAIEQLLEEFNDDQIVFRLEVEAYEQGMKRNA